MHAVTAIIILCFFVVCAIVNINEKTSEDTEFRTASFIIATILSFLLGAVVNDCSNPSIQDYLNKNVTIEIKQAYKNGELIKSDTSYRKL